jgi:hypothetical protein
MEKITLPNLRGLVKQAGLQDAVVVNCGVKTCDFLLWTFIANAFQRLKS